MPRLTAEVAVDCLSLTASAKHQTRQLQSGRARDKAGTRRCMRVQRWRLDEVGSVCGQFSRVQSGKMGPAPGRFDLSKGISKSSSAMVLGFETLNLKSSELK